MNRILFLDVDGVLNAHDTKPGEGVRSIVLQRPFSTKRVTGVVDEAKLRMVLGIVEECEAEIVVSSSWRAAFHSAAAFAATIGIPPLAEGPDYFHEDWCTEQKFSASRAQEIGLWLADHKEVRRFAILDDHDVCMRAPDLAKHFVRTDPAVGVTGADLRRVAGLLGYPNMN